MSSPHHRPDWKPPPMPWSCAQGHDEVRWLGDLAARQCWFCGQETQPSYATWSLLAKMGLPPESWLRS